MGRIVVNTITNPNDKILSVDELFEIGYNNDW